MPGRACGVVVLIGTASILGHECTCVYMCVCNAGNELGAEGGAAIGDGIKSCPHLSRLILDSEFRGSRGGGSRVQWGDAKGCDVRRGPRGCHVDTERQDTRSGWVLSMRDELRVVVVLSMCRGLVTRRATRCGGCGVWGMRLRACDVA